MPADPRALRLGAAMTTLIPAHVPETGRFRLPAVAHHSPMLLDAACGFSLGCDTYLLNRRLLPAANMEVSQ
ncbi:hypothetical protein [Nonomuraea basaltis]|uniref:hypothetical protein n=1 Tax=Nonomuraea basaltis TaxID=2495887 RepID=UPI00110C590A|nr:hypothetical protein [Nonomuraea basaltis]TMR96363.1 hypothetical protein EJK15_23515 [Nonomuraea basaltis]